MQLELDDIQGLVRRGYSGLTAARYLLLRITDSAAARAWLQRVRQDVTDATRLPRRTCTNLAFSWEGLAELGLADSVLAQFPGVFRRGMAADDCQRRLGDTGENAPQHWVWGGPKAEPVHVCLLVFSSDGSGLEEQLERYRDGFADGGVVEVHQLETNLLDGREHFGFRDGVGQPAIAGMHMGGRPHNTIAPGEVLLGYPGQSGRPAPGPADFGRNGSFLVLRQLEQRVHTYWQTIVGAWRRATDAGPDAEPDVDACIRIASKMVGRWPSGASLARYPDGDPVPHPGGSPTGEDFDDFSYAELDPDHMRCPAGAHVRRCNPRDSLAPGPARSLMNAQLHRILRRGRPYGPPVVASMDPREILASADDGVERGLQFVCLNANLSQQFEFVQQNWVVNPKFEGLLYDETDPVAGVREIASRPVDGFTIQREPVRRRLHALPAFVRVRGGAYLFLPGLRALDMLARPVDPATS